MATSHKIAAAAATLAIAEPAMALMHTGGVGLIVGGVLALAAYHSVDDLVEKAGRETSRPATAKPANKRGQALMHRLMWGNGSALREIEELEPDLSEESGELPEYHLNLGPKLRPHINALLSRRLAILGMPGHGKSNAVSVLVEELGAYSMPLLILDQKPEYAGLCNRPWLSNPYQADASILSVATAYNFGFQMMDERLQVVLDLRSFGNDTAAAKVMIQILAGICAWQQQYNIDDRLPCMIFLEEAHYWLPQNPAMSTVSRQEKDGEPSIFAQLQQAFFTLVTGGRSLAMGIAMITQRPADIDNRAINLADWKILFKADMPAELKVYRALGAKDEDVNTLPEGRAYIKGLDGWQGVYQWRVRRSPDEGKTPGVEALRKKTRSTSPAPSQASSVAASSAPSQTEPLEASGRSTGSNEKGSEVEAPLPQLSELENRVGTLFFQDHKNVAGIVKVLYPDITGGNLYIKKTEEINEAIRRYSAAIRHAAVQAVREENA